jgi:hypothetical protein
MDFSSSTWVFPCQFISKLDLSQGQVDEDWEPVEGNAVVEIEQVGLEKQLNSLFCLEENDYVNG